MSAEVLMRYDGGVHLRVHLTRKSVMALQMIKRQYPAETNSELFTRLIWLAAPVYIRLLNGDRVVLEHKNGNWESLVIPQLKNARWKAGQPGFGRLGGTIEGRLGEFDISSACMRAIEFVGEESGYSLTTSVNRLLQLGLFLHRHCEDGGRLRAQRIGQTEVEYWDLEAGE